MNYAYIEDGIVRELLTTNQDIKELYHPAMLWVGCTSGIEVGYVYAEGSFTAPIIEPEPIVKADIEKLRLIAYADPITGCDRYFSEVLSLQAEGFSATSTEVEDIKAKALEVKNQIKLLYPWPI